jgi:hypothetical protein
MQYSLWYVVPNTLPVGDLVTEELTPLPVSELIPGGVTGDFFS